MKFLLFLCLLFTIVHISVQISIVDPPCTTDMLTQEQLNDCLRFRCVNGKPKALAICQGDIPPPCPPGQSVMRHNDNTKIAPDCCGPLMCM